MLYVKLNISFLKHYRFRNSQFISQIFLIFHQNHGLISLENSNFVTIIKIYFYRLESPLFYLEYQPTILLSIFAQKCAMKLIQVFNQMEVCVLFINLILFINSFIHSIFFFFTCLYVHLNIHWLTLIGRGANWETLYT